MASITQIVRDTAGDIREALFTRALTKTPPEAIKENINHLVDTAKKKTLRGMLAVAASGFGKGLIFTALVVAIGLGLYGGLAGSEFATFGQGVANGLLAAVNFLGAGPGFVTLLVGGALGAVAETRGAQNNITAELAAAQAQNFELARQLGRMREPGLAPVGAEAAVQDSVPACSQCARELERRANAQQQLLQGR